MSNQELKAKFQQKIKDGGIKTPYRLLQAKLRLKRDQGWNVPPLNSKREVLEAAVNEIRRQITLKMLSDHPLLNY
jgi:hypothetical protein